MENRFVRYDLSKKGGMQLLGLKFTTKYFAILFRFDDGFDKEPKMWVSTSGNDLKNTHQCKQWTSKLSPRQVFDLLEASEAQPYLDERISSEPWPKGQNQLTA